MALSGISPRSSWTTIANLCAYMKKFIVTWGLPGTSKLRPLAQTGNEAGLTQQLDVGKII